MKTILLVEDEILLREGVQETLEVNGYRVIGAADGVEFIEQLRVKYPKLPVIVASGSPDSVQSRLGIANIHVPGATACITKPFKGKDLVVLVEKVISEAAA